MQKWEGFGGGGGGGIRGGSRKVRHILEILGDEEKKNWMNFAG